MKTTKSCLKKEEEGPEFELQYWKIKENKK
jgi:hypothetical protein